VAHGREGAFNGVCNRYEISRCQCSAAVFYIVAMAALALHLYHGAWSSLRTLGVAQASVSPLKRRAAVIIAIAIAAGFAVVPLAVLLGVVK